MSSGKRTSARLEGILDRWALDTVKGGYQGPFSVVYEGLVPKLQEAAIGLIVPFKKAPPPGSISSPDLLQFMEGTHVDSEQWKAPPHLAFANMRFENPTRIESFIKRYGLSGHFCNKKRGSGQQWFIDPAFLQKCQGPLWRAWRGKIGELWFHPRSVTLDAEDGQLRIVVRDLWTFICISFFIDRSLGRIGVCKFEGCKFLPYFLKLRRGQQFCCKECRALANMREWRLDPRNRLRESERRQKRKSRRLDGNGTEP